jgi:hypothetical protein
MDTATSHLLQKLDAIERAIGDMRREILDAVGKTTSAEPKKRLAALKLTPFWRAIVGGSVGWSIVASCRAYLEHGGKPLELIEALLKIAL